MKKLIAFSIALLSVLSITLLQGCSSSDDNNKLTEPQTLTVNQSNLERKWLTTHYAFSSSINKATKTAYQVSSIEINLSNGNYTLYDRYSQKSDKGTYTLHGNIITMNSLEAEETIKLKIERLTQSEIILTAIEHKHLTSVELIAIK